MGAWNLAENTSPGRKRKAILPTTSSFVDHRCIFYRGSLSPADLRSRVEWGIARGRGNWANHVLQGPVGRKTLSGCKSFYWLKDFFLPTSDLCWIYPIVNKEKTTWYCLIESEDNGILFQHGNYDNHTSMNSPEWYFEGSLLDYHHNNKPS